MSTLIAVYNADGLIGQCDQYCYDDVDVGCACICNGLNHGVGFAQAVKNTARHCAAWVHRDNFPADVGLPTAVRLHPAVHETQVVLNIQPGPYYLMLRKKK